MLLISGVAATETDVIARRNFALIGVACVLYPRVFSFFLFEESTAIFSLSNATQETQFLMCADKKSSAQLTKLLVARRVATAYGR